MGVLDVVTGVRLNVFVRRPIAPALSLLLLLACTSDDVSNAETSPDVEARAEMAQWLFVAESREALVTDTELTLIKTLPNILVFGQDDTENPVAEITWDEFIGYWDNGEKTFADYPPTSIVTGMARDRPKIECNVEVKMTAEPQKAENPVDIEFGVAVESIEPSETKEICAILDHLCVYIDTKGARTLPGRDGHNCDWCCPAQVGWGKPTASVSQ